MTTTDNGAGQWWDWHLFGLWVLVNAAAAHSGWVRRRDSQEHLVR